MVVMNSSGHLKSVAKGASWIASGNIGSMILRLITGILLIRVIAKGEYGLVALGYVIVSFCAAVSMLGVSDGVPRFIGDLRGKGVNEIGKVSGTALLLSLISSLIAAVGIFYFSPQIALSLDKPELAEVLSGFALLVPPIVLSRTLSAIYRGVQQSKQKVIFENWVAGIARLGLLAALLALGMGLQGVIIAYVSAMWVAFIAYAGYSIMYLPGKAYLSFDVKLAKALLWFSLPLLGASIFGRLGEWVHTIILGAMRTEEEVALYSAPIRLMALLTFPVISIRFIYGPLSSKLFASGDHDAVGSLYKNISKWSATLTLPLMIYLFVDAQFVVMTIFGKEYEDAVKVMRVLLIGYGIHGMLGPNGATLVFSGDSRSMLFCSVIGVSISITLALLAIPKMGALGAAIAVSAGLAVSNLTISGLVFRRLGIHPFDKSYVIPISAIIIIGFVLQYIVGMLDVDWVLAHLAVFVVFLLTTFSAPMITKSISKDDIQTLAAVERRLLSSTNITNWLESWSCPRGNRSELK